MSTFTSIISSKQRSYQPIGTLDLESRGSPAAPHVAPRPKNSKFPYKGVFVSLFAVGLFFLAIFRFTDNEARGMHKPMTPALHEFAPQASSHEDMNPWWRISPTGTKMIPVPVSAHEDSNPWWRISPTGTKMVNAPVSAHEDSNPWWRISPTGTKMVNAPVSAHEDSNPWWRISPTGTKVGVSACERSALPCVGHVLGSDTIVRSCFSGTLRSCSCAASHEGVTTYTSIFGSKMCVCALHVPQELSQTKTALTWKMNLDCSS